MAIIGYTNCPVCEARGSTSDGKRCEPCEGRGQIPVDDGKPGKEADEDNGMLDLFLTLLG